MFAVSEFEVAARGFGRPGRLAHLRGGPRDVARRSSPTSWVVASTRSRRRTAAGHHGRPGAPGRPPRDRGQRGDRVATIVEVRVADGIGVLARITQAIVGCDLRVHQAFVSTLGHEVVDTFYVTGTDGGNPRGTRSSSPASSRRGGRRPRRVR